MALERRRHESWLKATEIEHATEEMVEHVAEEPGLHTSRSKSSVGAMVSPTDVVLEGEAHRRVSTARYAPTHVRLLAAHFRHRRHVQRFL